MKLSNFILTLILALAVTPFLQSQSNSVREISIDNDEETIYIRYENGDLLELEIDGETISKSEYNKYEKLLEKYSNSEPTPPTPPTPLRTIEDDIEIENEDMGSVLHEKLRRYLVDIDVMNSFVYKLKLTPNYIKLNGKKLENEVLNKCLMIFEQIAGYELNKGSYFKAKITSNSRSISLSIED